MSNQLIFERSSLSKLKGFSDLNSFDEYIQNALNKYYSTKSIPKLDETAEKFHDYIINDDSLIPDLIIYNKPFNKNECYYEYYSYGFNKYPRKKFILNENKDINNNSNIENINNIQNEKIINDENGIEDKENLIENNKEIKEENLEIEEKIKESRKKEKRIKRKKKKKSLKENLQKEEIKTEDNEKENKN